MPPVAATRMTRVLVRFAFRSVSVTENTTVLASGEMRTSPTSCSANASADVIGPRTSWAVAVPAQNASSTTSARLMKTSSVRVRAGSDRSPSPVPTSVVMLAP